MPFSSTPTSISRPSAPPKDLDWDMWLGPRPMRPYQATITPYFFRWWHLYSSQMANQGVHFLDVMRWLVAELAPASVCAMGGRYVIDDDRTVPDVMQTMFEFASGRLLVYGQFETTGHRVLPRPAFAELRGTQGTLYASDGGFEVLPDRGGAHQDNHEPRMDPINVKVPEENYHSLTVKHTRNFLDCVKSRGKPNADIEIGHRSTTMSHLANISLAIESRIKWDAEREVITNNEEANDLLDYEYRKPWKLG